MWNRINIKAFILFTGCFLLLMSLRIQSAPVELYKEYTDSALVGNNKVININSKKGNLKIFHWDKQMVWVKIKIVFKNQDPEIARKELEYARFNFMKTVSGINISNYFSLPPEIAKIQSVVIVDYQVYLPEKVTLVINNEYGLCSLNNLDAFVNINNKYGNIELNMVKGQIRVFANLCDIQMNDFSGNFELFASNSNLNMKNFNGNVTVNNKVGKMIFEPGEELDYLKVTSSYSEVDLLIKNIYRFNYELTAKNATIELGNNFRQFPFQLKSKEKMVYQSEDTNRIIEIFTSYNSIKLQ